MQLLRLVRLCRLAGCAYALRLAMSGFGVQEQVGHSAGSRTVSCYVVSSVSAPGSTPGKLRLSRHGAALHVLNAVTVCSEPPDTHFRASDCDHNRHIQRIVDTSAKVTHARALKARTRPIHPLCHPCIDSLHTSCHLRCFLCNMLLTTRSGRAMASGPLCFAACQRKP